VKRSPRIKDRIFIEPQVYDPKLTAALIREQSRQHFGRQADLIESRSI
jgi:hypothetical protein